MECGDQDRNTHVRRPGSTDSSQPARSRPTARSSRRRRSHSAGRPSTERPRTALPSAVKARRSTAGPARRARSSRRAPFSRPDSTHGPSRPCEDRQPVPSRLPRQVRGPTPTVASRHRQEGNAGGRGDHGRLRDGRTRSRPARSAIDTRVSSSRPTRSSREPSPVDHPR